ncbi:MAG: tetratricopeptide repeat protein [Flectobacillus sp.]|uniref:type IX secretion system periplasmic lipoprotein PorW/SprE n=1 Tax=Flectobacillus sp. TaxID=50419 RepID=UPI003B99D062
MNRISLLLLLLIFWGILGCSQYSSSPISVGFHNLNAKYNALFQANQKMFEAEKKLFEERHDNYSQLLPILLPLDSTVASTVSSELNAVIKKASMVAERHQNSRWLDDAYVLIGQARLVQEDYKNAIETFKYVNTTATDDNARHAALIGLMRAYVEQAEFTTALKVAELLREEDLNKNNTANFYLTKAYLHQLRKEYAISVAILEEALPLLPKNEQKARLYYIKGQLYELLAQFPKSSESFSKVAKNRPSYDLRFYASLNSALVMNQKGNFDKLLKDSKNKDLSDKIYEAMASAEMRQGNTTKGIELLKKSASISKDTKQLPYTYLTLAELYYDKYAEYETASAYYDSCLSLLPNTDAAFAKVKQKQQVLSEFVKQMTIVKTEDSLQKLSKLSPAELDKVLEKAIRLKKAQELANLEKAKEIIASSTTAPKDPFATPGKTDWYFSNTMLVSQGRTNFVNRWGNRPLEDNWRRSSREDASSFASFNTPSTENTSASNNTIEGISDKELATEKALMKTRIPFGTKAFESSQIKRQDAMFEVGKIFKLSLNEPKKSISTFKQLLSEYPNSIHEPEALYFLYLLHENNPTEKANYRKALFDKFGDSYFARMLSRENIVELSSDKESEAQKLYSEAYQYYQQGNFADALSFVDTALKEYPNSHTEDKLAFLKALLLAKTQNFEGYVKALNDFIKDYPKSQLLGLVKENLAAAKSTKP